MTLLPHRAVFQAFRQGWRTLAAVHLGFALISSAISVPLAALAIQGAVFLSGEAAISDTDIAHYLFSPGGMAAGLIIGTLVISLQLLGYATLLIPARSLLKSGHCHGIGIPPILIPALPGMLRLSLRFIVYFVLWTAPFAALLGAIHHFLLGEHDINFYLAEKPPAFLWALLLAALVMCGHLLVVARLSTNWVHALPLVIFRREHPDQALRLSREAADGERKELFAGFIAWAVITPVVSSALNLPWSAIALWASDHLATRLDWLVVVLGICLALSMSTSWITAFTAMSLLAIQNMRLYQNSSLDDSESLPESSRRPLPVSFRTAVIAALALATFTVYLSATWVDQLDHEKSALIIAHRGASAEAPENTLAAVEAALDAGAHWVEIDVQESADGSVWVFHDSDFKRMGGPAKPIWEMRDAEIASIDVGSWKAAQFSDQRAPLLTDVLALCKGRAGVLIELKYYGHSQRLEERVVELVESAGMEHQVMIMSLSHEGIRKLHRLRPEWKVGLLSSIALGDVTRLQLDFLGMNARTTSRKLIREADKRGLEVFVWTVNQPIEMSRMLGRGVDGLITDHPALAKEVIQERAESTLGEKLLMDLAALLGKEPANPKQ